MRITRFCYLPTVMFASVVCLSGEDGYMGAEELLGKVASEMDAGKSGEDPAEVVRADLRGIIEKSDGFSEKDAAAAWVSLVAKYFAIPAAKRNNLANERPPLNMATLFEGLPRPEAWDELSAAISGLPADSDPMLRESLRLIDATLSGGMEKQIEAMDALEKTYLAKKKGDAWAERYAKQYFENAERELNAAAGGDLLSAFRTALETAEAKKDDGNMFGSPGMNMPALAGAVEEKEAVALIIRTLKTGQDFSINDEPTKRLVAKVMLANPDTIIKPVWNVVETPAEIPLFELMDGKTRNDDWRFTTAEENYMRSLLEVREYDKAHARITRRAKEGVKVDFNPRMETLSEDKERVGELLGFFTKLLKEDPTYPYWDTHAELAEKAGKTDGALLAMKAAMDSAEEGTEHLETLRDRIIHGLLSGGRTEEAVAFLRDIVRKMSADGAITNDAQARKLVEHSQRLARMARLLGKPDLVDEAFAAAEKAVVVNRKLTDRSEYTTLGIIGELVAQDRGAKAEELLADELIHMSRLKGDSRQSRDGVMTALAYVYSEAGRHADVVGLLENGTMWDKGDIADLRQNEFEGKPLMLIAAEALHAEGRNDIALQLLDRVFETESGNDAAYALLLAIGGEGVIGKLDRIHAEDRFEERPLIWKAKALSDAGKLDEAEKVAKAAIAIDPSDGEQGKGDRMRVYAVLGEIMEKKGDKKQAEFLERVVAAIRLSETGDEWWEAGMQKRAIAIYEDSLKKFADAYCIQSRLALRYAEMGDFEKAEEHYRRAFELMPESFGRVESHCFGCEGAFSGKLAQGIAESVFLKLAKEMPDRAQVFYLLGYLRDQQDRKADAAEYFAKAVKIDPDYINAWRKLGSVADEAGLPVVEKDRIQLELFRLNPNGTRLDSVTDLSRLWSAALEADKEFVPDQNGPVFALRASKQIAGEEYDGFYSSYHHPKTSPRTQLASHRRISQMVQLLESIWRN